MLFFTFLFLTFYVAFLYTFAPRVQHNNNNNNNNNSIYHNSVASTSRNTES